MNGVQYLDRAWLRFDYMFKILVLKMLGYMFVKLFDNKVSKQLVEESQNLRYEMEEHVPEKE